MCSTHVCFLSPQPQTITYQGGDGKLHILGSNQPDHHQRARSTYVPATETDFLGTITQYIWETTRRLQTSVTRAFGKPEQQTTTTQWHPHYALPETVTEGTRQTRYTYDDKGNILTRTTQDTSATGAGLSLTHRYTYNAQGLLATSTAPGGAVTTYGYDSAGNLTSIQNPLRQTTTLGYDGAGHVTRVTDPNGIQTNYQYDAMGRMRSRSVQGTSGQAETDLFTYHPTGQMATAALACGLTLTYSYDAAHRLIGITDNHGNSISYTLDGMGNRVQTLARNADGSAAL